MPMEDSGLIAHYHAHRLPLAGSQGSEPLQHQRSPTLPSTDMRGAAFGSL